MQVGALLVSAWLTFGVFTGGGLVVYDPPAEIAVAGSVLVDMGVEANWGPLFAGGSIMVPSWAGTDVNFWPTELISTTDVGLEGENIRVGWKHTCAHSVVPYLPLLQMHYGELRPRWDSAYDLFYMTIRTKN